MSFEEVIKQLKELQNENLMMKQMYENERDEKYRLLDKFLSDFDAKLVETNSQLEECRRTIKLNNNVSPDKTLSDVNRLLKSTNSQLDDLSFTLKNNILLLQEEYSSKNLKRRKEEKEEEYFSKKRSKKKINDGKIGIFIHMLGERDCTQYEIASRIYKIEMESDKYRNPSPPLMSFRDRYNNIRAYRKVRLKSEPLRIKPVFNFTFEEGYPLGMACVLFGSQHHLYLMGGSTTYTLLYTKSKREVYHLYDNVNATDHNMYPPDVYVFDCLSCQLLSPQDSPPPMNSGKSVESFTFVDNGKLYVLSSTTKVPKGLHMFEVFDPNLRSWTILKDPPYDWGGLYCPLGSVLIDGVFFVSYSQDRTKDGPVHIFSYNIANKEWKKKISVHRPLSQSISVVPSFERDSVFVGNKIYSTNLRRLIQRTCFELPILSYGPIPTTTKLDAYDFDVVATPNLAPIFPWDACWPIYNGGIGRCRSARLVHLGGLLEGTKNDTTCFGYVQVVERNRHRGCYIRFVAFEALNYEIACDSDIYKEAARSAAAADSVFSLPDKCVPFFKARTLHANHFYSSGKFERSWVNAVCAVVLS